MLNFELVDDTFGEWLSRKKTGIKQETRNLNRSLVDSVLKSSEAYIPNLSGSLFESGYEHLVFSDGFDYNNIAVITWTGEDNPDEGEFTKFANLNKEDYALSNYLGYYYATGGKQPLKLWWPKIVKDLEDTIIEDKLGVDFLKWLEQ